MKKKRIRMHLDKAIEKQVPDAWDEINQKMQKMDESDFQENTVHKDNHNSKTKTHSIYKRLLLPVVASLIFITTLTFTPALASLQEVYDKIFSSKHIDDSGLKTALYQGQGQILDQAYYDEKHDITVHFESVMTDDKETKLLLTYQSESLNLENHFIDIFEGVSTIELILKDGQKKILDNVGWGSSYYNSEENKMAEALSFDSIKEFVGQDVRLEINNLTVYSDQTMASVPIKWPVEFTLQDSATSDRETVKLNKEFSFKNKTYTIKKVEFSSLETRVVVTGSDVGIRTREDGMRYRVMSELEHQFLNARKVDEQYGYIVDEGKSGVFLRSSGERADPIFSKGEVEGADDEYIMVFAPVKDRKKVILEIGDSLKIPLTK